MEIDKNIILKLISVLEDLKKSLNDKNYKIEDFKIDSQSSPAKVEEDSAKSIKSPIVGTAYLAPEPGAKKLMLLDSGARMGNRMVSTSLTYEDIAQQLASDERFDPEAKCKLARRMFEPKLSNGLCIDN